MLVWQVFKEPLECPTLRGGPILSPEDVKGIFGNVLISWMYTKGYR